jgi:hypothetical protein
MLCSSTNTIFSRASFAELAEEDRQTKAASSWSLDTKWREFTKQIQCPPYIELLRNLKNVLFVYIYLRLPVIVSLLLANAVTKELNRIIIGCCCRALIIIIIVVDASVMDLM